MVIDPITIGAVIATMGTIATAVFLYLGTVKRAQTDIKLATNAKNIEAVKEQAIQKAEASKVEAVAKADVVKAETKADTDQLRILIDSSLKRIDDLQNENREYRVEMRDGNKAHREELMQLSKRLDSYNDLMTICIEERGKFKLKMEQSDAMYRALEAQLKSVKAFELVKMHEAEIAADKEMQELTRDTVKKTAMRQTEKLQEIKDDTAQIAENTK